MFFVSSCQKNVVYLQKLLNMDQPKLQRMLELMMCLASNHYSTIEDISKRFGMSTRSIYRYIDTFKEAGFVVEKLPNKIVRLSKKSPFFEDISDLVFFTKEEAFILKSAIESIDTTNLLKQNLQKKLASIYDFRMVADIVTDSKSKNNVQKLIQAIDNGKQVMLEGYNSAHSDSVTDRLVEPFGFTTNCEQVWCYEIESQLVKTFKVSRIGQVEIMTTDWQFQAFHQQRPTDIFRFQGNEYHDIKLSMTVRAANLLMEEYPLSKKYLKRVSSASNRWVLETKVCEFEGVTRFILGLYDDIKILENDKLKKFVNQKINKMKKK